MHEKRFNREIERLRDPARVARLEVEQVVKLTLENLAGVQKVLDVGTGTGLFAEQFAKSGVQVSGLDANPAMVAAAHGYVPSGIFQEGIAEKLPFPDQSFDLVFMGLLLHETDDPLAAMKEAHRVASKGITILEWPDEDQPAGPPREHRLAFETVKSLAQQAGFKDLHLIKLENLVLYWAARS